MARFMVHAVAAMATCVLARGEAKLGFGVKQ